jgi:hypothetical protein
VLDEKDLQATNEFRRQTELLWTALKGFGLEIGRMVEPMLAELANMLRQAVLPVFYVFKAVIALVAVALESLMLGLNIVMNTMVVLIATVVALVKELDALAHWDKEAAVAAWVEWKAAASGALDDVAVHADAMNDRLKHLVKGPSKAEKEEHSADPNKGMRTPGDLAIVEAQSKAMLDIAKESIRERGELNENWHKQELESDGTYWATKIKLEQEGLDAQIASLKHSLSVTQAAAKSDQPGSENQKQAKAKEIALIGQIQVAEKQRADAAVNGQREMKAAVDARVASELTAEIENSKKIQLSQVDAQATVLSRKKDLRLISDADEVKASEELELQKLSIERTALVKQQALYDTWTDKYKSIQQQIAALDADTAKKREELTTKSIESQNVQWKKLFDSMDSGFQSTIRNFLKGTASLGDTIRGLYTDVVDAIIGELARMAAAWLTQQLAMLVFGKAAAVGSIQTEAAKAGAGGVASMAAAPYPLDLTAPAFGAAMFAASSAYAAMPGFAVGSWNVPGDAFTKIHKGEMIMPAQFAEPLRNGSMGGQQTINMPIHAMDAESVARLLTQNGSAVMSALRRQLRGFNGRSAF